MLQTTQGATTTQYLYRLDRLAAVAGSSRTWYGSDALGSVRQTLSDTGVPLSNVNYYAWGAVESGTVPTFGFTGEVQDVSSGLVNLRARWYSTARGTFTSRDPFAGMPATPYSQHPYASFRWQTRERFDEAPYNYHPYAYALSNPVLYVDPAGEAAALPGDGGRSRHASSGEKRTDLGILIGMSGAFSGLGIGTDFGVEAVYDLYDFESAIFTYGGSGAALSSWGVVSTTILEGLSKVRCPITAGGNGYIGGVTGWSNYDKPWIDNYAGPFRTYSGGGTLPVIAPLIIGGQAFVSLDGNMSGMAASVGLGNDKLPVGGSVMVNDYSQPNLKMEFHGKNNLGEPTPPTTTQTELFILQVTLQLGSSPLTQAFVPLIRDIIHENARIWNAEY